MNTALIVINPLTFIIIVQTDGKPLSNVSVLFKRSSEVFCVINPIKGRFKYALLEFVINK